MLVKIVGYIVFYVYHRSLLVSTMVPFAIYQVRGIPLVYINSILRAVFDNDQKSNTLFCHRAGRAKNVGVVRVILIGEFFSQIFDIFFAQFFNLPYFPDFFFQILEC